MSLTLYTSNRLEVLLDRLAGLLRTPLRAVFEREVIVVQSRGMQRWLSMELARRFGVWGNARYPFPNAMVQELFALLPEQQESAGHFSVGVMAWKIMGLLPGLLPLPEFESLRYYLADDPSGLKLFQLSEMVADTFDQYTLFRADMLREWEEGGAVSGADQWQPVLWRLLVAGGGMHRGRLQELFCRQAPALLRGGGAKLPERVSLFGVSYLPDFHLEVFSALSEMTELHLFLMSPTSEYWGDIVSRKSMLLRPEAEQALRSEGNPLLASLGKMGRDFSERVVDFCDRALLLDEAYLEPGEATLLHALQSDILHLSGAGEDGARVRVVADGDRSVSVHCCHSPMREIEVLHDRLLALLEEFPDLEPRDIVVMTPDIELYAPYVSAVFGHGAHGGGELRHTIADRRLMHEGDVAASVLALLALLQGRVVASELFDLLSKQPVRDRFGFSVDELLRVRTWIDESGIRWGLDADEREASRLPRYPEHSWKSGLERLLLGYAMPEEDRLFRGVLPYDGVMPAEADLLGRFVLFVERVGEFVRLFRQARTPTGWALFFQTMLEAFVVPSLRSEREYLELVALRGELERESVAGGFDELVSPSVMVSWFRSRIERQEQGFGFMTGGITFCAMLPMRSIPFRVVALVGMHDGAFPRQGQAPGFDLMARDPRRGDRSLRDEDRYLFLESLLSARDVLLLSYVGRSVRDNVPLPPSVLVSELLDAVRRGFVFADGRPVEEHLVAEHRMQGFNRAYFSAGSPLYSYSSLYFDALRERDGGVKQHGWFVDGVLDELPAEWRGVELADLLRFYENPSLFFLERRLGIRLEASLMPLRDADAFGLDGLERYTLAAALLECMVQDGGEPEEMLPLFRARGLLPPGEHGDDLFRSLHDETASFAAVVLEQGGLGPGVQRLEPVDCLLSLGSFTLRGRLERVWPERQLFYRGAKIRVRDRIRSWICHLVLCAVSKAGYPAETRLVMVDDCVTYGAVDNAGVLLEALLRVYWQGLSEPVRFFPRSSYAFAAKGSLEAARREWEDASFGGVPGEGADPACARCFGSVDPFDGVFQQLAVELLDPMLQCSN